METKAIFACRIEELPFLGTLLLNSFTRDEDDFIELSPTYDTPFTTTFTAKVALVEEVVNPEKLTGEMKKLTQKLGTHFANGRNLLNRVEIYIGKAAEEKAPLTMAPKDFGIKAVRDEITLKNDEGAVRKLRILESNLKDNLIVLAPKGYSVAVQTELANLIKDLSADSIAQTKKKKDREKLVEENIGEFNTLWKMMTDIMKSGKAIYQKKDKTKVSDYTYDHIIKDVQLKRTTVSKAAKAAKKAADAKASDTNTTETKTE
jgi:hypothetical protein